MLATHFLSIKEGVWCEGEGVTEGANVKLGENWFHFPGGKGLVCWCRAYSHTIT